MKTNLYTMLTTFIQDILTGFTRKTRRFSTHRFRFLRKLERFSLALLVHPYSKLTHVRSPTGDTPEFRSFPDVGPRISGHPNQRSGYRTSDIPCKCARGPRISGRTLPHIHVTLHALEVTYAACAIASQRWLSSLATGKVVH